MKVIIAASLLVPALAFADRTPAPKGPDFVNVAPSYLVDRTVAVSDGMQPIEPLEILTFDLDSTALDPTSITELDVLASWMKKYPEQHAVIEGHTDRLGTSDYNLDLGKRRAMAARDHLMSWGISSDRIVLSVWGERDAHQAENPADRRVVVYASDRPVRELVGAILDSTRAHTVAWTERGTKLEQSRGLISQK